MTPRRRFLAIGRGRLRLRAALLALVAGVLVAPTADAGGLPRAAGVTTITASGTAGLHLQVPRWTGIDMDKVRLVPGARTTYAFVLLRADVQRCGDVRIPVCDFTILAWVKGHHGNIGTPHQGDAGHDFESIATNPPQQAAGAAKVYIVADGPVTVQWRFTSLPGTTTLAARRSIRAGAGRLPDVCPDVCRMDGTSTMRMAYGGRSVPLPRMSFAYTLAYLDKAGQWTDGIGHGITAEALACLKPSHFDPIASTDPADYVAGCSEPPKNKNQVKQALYTAGECASTNVIGNNCQIFNPSATRRAYFGYRTDYVDQWAALPNEAHPTMGGAYLWIEYGLR